MSDVGQNRMIDMGKRRVNDMSIGGEGEWGNSHRQSHFQQHTNP